MKRIIALVLTLFVFAIVPVASAAGTATLSITASDIDPETGVFYLALTGDTKVIAASVSIDYDGSKVALYDIDTDDGESTIEDQDDAEYAFKLPNSGMFSKITLNADESYMKVDWFKTSAVRANKEVWQAYFIAKDKTGDSFDANTFKLVTDDNVLTTLTVKGNGGNVQWTDDASVKYHAESSENTVSLTFTYPNSDKGGEPDPTPSDTNIEEDFSTSEQESGYKSEEIASGTVSYGNTQIDMGANGKVHTFFAKVPADGAALEPLSYGVKATINGTYYYFPGKAKIEAGKAWAIKIVIPNGTFKDDVAANLTSMEKYIVE